MQRTLLIVEDVDTCASTLEIALSALDIEIVIANSAEQAWRLVQHSDSRLAAVVTDLEMRGMDGYELIQRIRGHADHEHVPIMVITGTADPDAQDRVRRLGANAFFTKPFSPAVVREQLEQWLNHAAT